MESKKIGNNYVLKFLGINHVLGGRESFSLFISLNIALFTLVLGWILSINYYYHYLVYIIGFIIYCITEYNAICCFITEPGIIPRGHLQYQPKDNDQINNESSNNSLLKEQDLEKNQTTSIPSIFTERYCSTCKIIRPPKASHCSYCDNCVLNFDHHCFFISNCVGARNHKYFSFVLFFGTILTIFIACCCIGHVVYVYITFNGPNIVYILFKEHLILMIIATVLIGLSIFLLSMGCCDYMTAGIPAAVGYAIVIVLFFISTSNQPIAYPYEYNPFSVIVLVGAVSLCLFGVVNLGKVCYNLFQGYTTKQLISIQREYMKASNQSKEYIEEGYLKPKTFREKMNNVFSLVCQKKIPSLIDPIQDLEPSMISIRIVN